MNATPYAPQRHINDHYDIVGFISSGTYGRVYKAVSKRNANSSEPEERVIRPDGQSIQAFAIKKFKPDKEGELQYTGISQCSSPHPTFVRITSLSSWTEITSRLAL